MAVNTIAIKTLAIMNNTTSGTVQQAGVDFFFLAGGVLSWMEFLAVRVDAIVRFVAVVLATREEAPPRPRDWLCFVL
jgi:hypothetical protein